MVLANHMNAWHLLGFLCKGKTIFTPEEKSKFTIAREKVSLQLLEYCALAVSFVESIDPVTFEKLPTRKIHYVCVKKIIASCANLTFS